MSAGKYGLVKCRERLRKLVEFKKIQRGRVDISQPAYFYTITKPSLTQLDHVIQRNWAFIWLKMNCKSWEKFNHLENEYVLGSLRADGFCQIENKHNIEQPNKFYFIESDKTGSKNQFNKVKVYNEMYQSKVYLQEYWAEAATKFPFVLVVTDSPTKALKIKASIKQDNKNDIKFQVITLNEIKIELLNTGLVSNSTVSYKGL
jgi:hypothetical protein